MPKERKQTKPPQNRKTSSQAAEARRPQLMQDLQVDRWADVPLRVLQFLTGVSFPAAAIRVYALVLLRSWGSFAPRDGQDKRIPSLFAIREVRRTKLGHFYAEPLRAVDIAGELEMDEGNVSKILAWLEGKKAIRIERKRIFPTATPDLDSLKKLVDPPTSWTEDPFYQQLENLKAEYREAILAATKAAIEPVRQEYLPRIAEVKTQVRSRIKDLKSGQTTLTEPQPEKVGESTNFQESSPTTSTGIQQETPEPAGQTPIEKVGESTNFQELSPIPRVGEITNSKMAQVDEKSGSKRSSKSYKALRGDSSRNPVGRSVEPSSAEPTDLPARVREAIIETGICTKLADTPSPELCREIVRRLNGIPFPIRGLKARIEARFAKITSLGMLTGLASDVAKAYAEVEALEQAKRPPAPVPIDPLETLVVDLEFSSSLPNHPSTPAISAQLETARLRDPELFARAEAEVQRRRRKSE